MNKKPELSPSAYMALAMVGGGASTGYAIKQGLERVAGFFWTASYGQIYPDLKRLEAAGLIDGREESGGGRLRRVFTLTERGESELRRWLSEPAEPAVWVRHEGIMRLMIVDWDDRELAIKNVAELRRTSEQRLELIGELEPPLERGRRIQDLGTRVLRETIAWCDETEAFLRDQG